MFKMLKTGSKKDEIGDKLVKYANQDKLSATSFWC